MRICFILTSFDSYIFSVLLFYCLPLPVALLYPPRAPPVSFIKPDHQKTLKSQVLSTACHLTSRSALERLCERKCTVTEEACEEVNKTPVYSRYVEGVARFLRFMFPEYI